MRKVPTRKELKYHVNHLSDFDDSDNDIGYVTVNKNIEPGGTRIDSSVLSSQILLLRLVIDNVYQIQEKLL